MQACTRIEGACAVTSVPDVSEIGKTLPVWREWFLNAVHLVVSAVPADSAALFFQSDIKRDGTWIDKGALATVPGLPPSNITLVAPTGTIDAGIRSTGNLSLAASAVLNAGNIQTGGTTVGAPATPNLGALSSASSSTAVASGPALGETRNESGSAKAATRDLLPSLFSIEVIGYGGGDEEEEEDKKAAEITETAS